MTRARRILRRAARALGGASLVALTAIAWLVATTDVDRARFVHPEDAVTITDRHGQPLRHHRPDGEDRRWVRLEDVSPHLIDAILATEDHRFFEHAGVDARATGRAALSFLLPGRRASGGSTITQQVIKLVYGRPDGLVDKPREIVRAIRLERARDKRWILEQYLNRLPYGDRVVGVARASELYLGVPVSSLSVGQAALIAGIPQAPSALDPRRHLPRAMARRRLVLARMRAVGRIDEATYRAALAEPVDVRRRPIRPWRAPRAADAALADARRGALPRAGGRIRTSLDLALTEEAERVLREAVRQHRARGVENGAAIVVDNASGDVLAYVGAARDGGDAPGGWLDLSRARRQPGSTLKPFVYALLFERGGTAATLLDDLSQPMVDADGALFTAEDYDGRERGPVLARDALSASLNLAALDAARRVGAHRVVGRLRALGMDELEGADRYGAAIVLGGADVSLLELAEAYVALARGGTRVPLGLGGPARAATRVIEPGAAEITRDVLMDARARREAFGDDLSADFGVGAFGIKTGTSSGWRDAWTAAFTDRVTVLVWLGDPAGGALGGLSGFEGAARPATRILAAAEARHVELGLAVHDRAPPALAEARICAVTGRLAGARCAHTRSERFVHGRVPATRCDAHREDGAVELAPRYARWIDAERPAGFVVGAPPPDEGTPRVAHPSDGARLLVDPRRGVPEVPLRATVAGATTPARWEIDGEALDGERWHPSEGPHTVVAVLADRRSDPVAVDVRYAR